MINHKRKHSMTKIRMPLTAFCQQYICHLQHFVKNTYATYSVLSVKEKSTFSVVTREKCSAMVSLNRQTHVVTADLNHSTMLSFACKANSSGSGQLWRVSVGNIASCWVMGMTRAVIFRQMVLLTGKLLA